MSLRETLQDSAKRDAVVDDCVQLVEDEVGNKRGLGGMVIKTGYKAVKGVKPGFIRKVVSSLIGDWADKLDPIWAEVGADGFNGAKSRVAEALLEVTDAKATGAKNKLVRSTYDKLRPTAKGHVEEAVPALGRLLAKHAG